MESSNFDAQQVVSWSNAGWHIKVRPASIGDHVVDTPLSSTKAIRGDLEPGETTGARGLSIGYLCEVSLNGSLNMIEMSNKRWSMRRTYVVGGSNWVIHIVGVLCPSDNVLPEGSYFRTGRDSDDGGGG